MRFKSILVFIVLLTIINPQARAQNPERELSSGLNYTTIYNKPKPETKDIETPDVAPIAEPQKPAAPKISMSAPQTPQEAQEAKEDNQTRVWNKYKALATGKAGKEQTAQQADPAQAEKNIQDVKSVPAEDQSVKTKTITPQLTHASGTAQPPASASSTPASGIAAILQEWKTSKTQQREMRSKSFKVPELPDDTETAPSP